ncbi:hypothetical protein [Cedecea neteri]|uniref:hypothetical protein n=1 Tax=Cedecea neteri TaxID=158822 RepID=UPI0028A216C7|nr:hypothetical protein [Cedecea neteri]
MNNLSRADLNAILAAADAVISAMAGENEDVHPDNTSKMIALWDDLNDRHAPPAVVKAMASELLALREAGKEPVAWWTGPEPTATGEIESIHDHETGSHQIPLYAAPQLSAVPDDAEQRLAAAVELLKQAAPHMLADESLKDPDGALCGKRRAVPDGDPRDEFELHFPIPKFVQRCGNGYSCSEFHAWGAHKFIDRWDGWNTCRAAIAAAPKLEVK